ncbi:MAG TPA: thioredoxin domain-containing protein [Gemmatimonadaceae bacterium]
MAKDRVAAGRGRSGEQVKGSRKGGAPARRVDVRGGSKTPFYILLGVIAAVAAGLIVRQATRPTSSGVITIDPNIPLPEGTGYLMGDAAAPVQVLEFADFECPACGSFATLTEPDMRKRLVETGQVSFRFLDYPLPMHPNSWDASFAAACANEQGKFWEMHDSIFATQDQWNGTVTNRPKAVFIRLARGIAVDESQWNDCYDSQKYKLNIAANQKEGDKWMVSSTPTFVIGDKVIRGALGFDQLNAYVDSAMARAWLVQPLPSGDSALKQAVPAGSKKGP